MTILQAVVLGIVQGLTEFLPISSTAHLVLTPALLSWPLTPDEIFIFNILVQWGTLLAVVIYFWSDLLPIGRGLFRSLKPGAPPDPDARLGWLLVLATLPAILTGLLLRTPIEAALGNPRTTAYLLLGTAALLVFAERVGRRSKAVADISSGDALLIGFFQALSLLPGISRSGATISGGMAVNLGRPAAARFAFLLSVPVMLGAGTLALLDLSRLPESASFTFVILVGSLAAALVGYAAIRWLLAYLAHGSLYPFAAYCAAISLLSLYLLR